jgi:putative DNA primase/helicase
MANEQRGATAEEWFHFDFVLGLGANLLPCVPAGPDVRVVSGSALEGKVGKIPSQFNAAGEAHGLLNWQKREILGNEVKLWSQDRRLNICVRTGPISHVYAVDVDIEDDRAFEVFKEIAPLVGGPVFYRGRPGSNKFLVPFGMEEPCKKRKIYLDDSHKGPAIELLADGQQFVAAGSHSSGSRYQWSPGLPMELPVLTLEQLNQIWQRLTSRYATASSLNQTPVSSGPKSVSTLEGSGTGSVTPTEASTSSSILVSCDDVSWQQLIEALRFLLPHVGSNDEWSQVGYALLSLQQTRPARELWLDFSQKAAGYEPGAPEAWWEAHKRAEPRTDYRHIFTMARQRGWGATSRPEDFSPVSAPQSPTPGTQSNTEEQTAGISGLQLPVQSDPRESAVLAAAPEKPIVRLAIKDFSQIIDQLETIAKPEMYTQGAGLVRLSPGHEDKEIERSADQIMLVGVTKAYARKRFGELATFYAFNKKKEEWTETAPSAEHVNALLDQGAWRKLRPLDAIARAPFVRRDGSICDTPGYDTRSRALFIPSTQYPRIPSGPDRGDAEGALARLRGVFHQFPWATGAAESAFISHVLSEAGRLAVNRCPMFFYNAPSAGTGKTLLQKAASIVAHGAVPALRPWVSDGDEVRKTIYASLLAGDRSLLFDNVPDGVKIRSAELCAAITAEIWQDRKLGESEARGVANRAVFSASGNNINPAGDLSRRAIVIRLDANTERLAQRRFDIEDLESYLVRERPRLLVDALTIIRAYHQTATTDITMPVPLASFEQWSHFIREPLIWLGMPDPVDTQTGDANEDSQNLASAFALLNARYGLNRFSGVDIAHAAGGIADTNGQLVNTLIAAGCREPNSPHKVGYWLRSNRDKVFGGMKLTAGVHTMSGMTWQFVKVE